MRTTCQPQQTNDKQTNDCNNSNSCPQDTEEGANDDKAFMSFCTAESSVLNNDPSRRYYINKLYRPLNGSSEDSQSGVEQEDALWLHQELQLNKILQDDDDDESPDVGDVDDDDVAADANGHRRHREDPLDRLQLTTIIESFDPFSSPLIDACNGKDPLMSEGICGLENVHDKPDSTLHGDSCPSSGRSSANSGLGIHSNHYNSYDHHNHQNQHQQQYSSNNTLEPIGHKNDTHFQAIDPHDPVNVSNSHLQISDQVQSHLNHHNQIIHHQQQQHQHQHHQQQHYQYHPNIQINHDNSSEISCFQPVSSSFMSPTNSTGFISPGASSSGNSAGYEHQYQTSIITSQDDFVSDEQNKSTSNATDQEDFVAPDSDSSSSRATKSPSKSRAKRKLSSDSDEKLPKKSMNMSMENNGNLLEDISSTQFENYKITNIQGDTIYTIKEDQQEKHINKNDSLSSWQSHSTGEQSTNESATPSGGRRRNPSMNKYRRCTANARERIRMREINLAFEKLKKVVPVEMIQQRVGGDESDQGSVSGRKSSTGKSMANQGSDSQLTKLTKITTLKLAVKYIAILSKLLDDHQCATGTMNVAGDNRLVSVDKKNLESSKDKTGRSKRKSHSATTRRRKSRTAIVSTGINTLTDETKPNKKLNATATSEQAKQNCNLSDPRTIARPALANGQIAIRLNEQAQRIVPNESNQQQQRQQQPVIIANGFVNRSMNQIQPLQQQKPQFAFAGQPTTVAIAPQNTGQERPSFVTPVAVAILGIPTNSAYPGMMNESQPIQILGIHQPNQRAQQQQSHMQANQQQQPQRIQQVQGNYSLVSQSPQQVTLTLNDINGLSVLRLANPQENTMNQQRTIQLQAGQNQQQPQQILAPNGQLNYAAIQPLQLSQVQPNNIQAIPQQVNQQNCNTSGLTQTNVFYLNPTNQRISGICPVRLQQTGEYHQQQQQHYSAQILQNGQQVQFEQQRNKEPMAQDTTNDKNSTTIMKLGSQPKHEQMKFVTQFSAQKEQGGQQEKRFNDSEASIRQLVANLTTSIRPNDENERAPDDGQPVEAKFETQKQHPQHQHHLQQFHPQQQQQQQPKRTYRFHNYDGNMITNNLYNNSNNNSGGNSGEKFSQQATNAKSKQQNGSLAHSSQRSRQNSLSSACSTTSSSSSSSSSTSSSPSSGSAASTTFNQNVPMLQTIMLESPPLDCNLSSHSNSSSSSNDTITNTTTLSAEIATTPPQVVGESIMANE